MHHHDFYNWTDKDTIGTSCLSPKRYIKPVWFGPFHFCCGAWRKGGEKWRLLKLLYNVTATFRISSNYSNILKSRGIGEELRIKINEDRFISIYRFYSKIVIKFSTLWNFFFYPLTSFHTDIHGHFQISQKWDSVHFYLRPEDNSSQPFQKSKTKYLDP